MKSKAPIVALMYDFDKTLSTKDMQEYGFIPDIGMSPSEFWEQADSLSVSNNMDRILAYMYLMAKKSIENNRPIRRDSLVELGEGIAFHEGVKGWFNRVNSYAKQKGIEIEHYIISSGLKEIIDGTDIAHHFKAVFACEFYYGADGTASWPQMTVNYTAKTQYLYRINKGVLDISNDVDLNKYVPEDDRRIPFRNMIYIGDGQTDIPCMKLVKLNGGHSLAVYSKGNMDKVSELLLDNRVDFLVPADYSEGTELDKIVKTIIDKIAVDSDLIRENAAQKKTVR